MAATFTFDPAHGYPDGTTVQVYRDDGQIRDNPPTGAAVASATVGEAGGARGGRARLRHPPLRLRAGRRKPTYRNFTTDPFIPAPVVDPDDPNPPGNPELMDGSLSSYAIKAIIDNLDDLAGGQLYVGLLDAADTEPSTAAGYSRQPVDLDPVTLGSSLTDAVADISIGPASSDWGQMTQVAIFDSATGGNLWLSEDLDEPQLVLANSIFTMAEADLDVIGA